MIDKFRIVDISIRNKNGDIVSLNYLRFEESSNVVTLTPPDNFVNTDYKDEWYSVSLSDKQNILDYSLLDSITITIQSYNEREFEKLDLREFILRAIKDDLHSHSITVIKDNYIGFYDDDETRGWIIFKAPTYEYTDKSFAALSLAGMLDSSDDGTMLITKCSKRVLKVLKGVFKVRGMYRYLSFCEIDRLIINDDLIFQVNLNYINGVKEIVVPSIKYIKTQFSFQETNLNKATKIVLKNYNPDTDSELLSILGNKAGVVIDGVIKDIQ